jgi:hypothetical protein
MKLCIWWSLKTKEAFIFDKVNSLRGCLIALKKLKGAQYSDKLLYNHYKYILIDSTSKLKPLALRKELVSSILTPYDTILVLQDIEGNYLIAAAVAAYFAVSMMAAYAIMAIVYIAVTLAVFFIMQALSPALSFDGDPAEVQHKESNLFGNVGIIREQGGIYPLIFGQPYSSGVLISSAILTSDMVV